MLIFLLILILDCLPVSQSTDSDVNDLETENAKAFLSLKNGYFGSEKCDFSLWRKDVPENTICYINNTFGSQKYRACVRDLRNWSDYSSYEAAQKHF